MKVYTTELKDGEVILNVYPSQKAFRETESWVDPRFINVACTEDLEGYEFANEKTCIVYTDIEIKSQLLLRDVYLNK